MANSERTSSSFWRILPLTVSGYTTAPGAPPGGAGPLPGDSAIGGTRARMPAVGPWARMVLPLPQQKEQNRKVGGRKVGHEVPLLALTASKCSSHSLRL
eukprot:2299718-Prymnesium_polylepis.1